MSDRVQGLIDDAIGRVPEHPGDIEVVRARALQRHRRQRGAGIAAALILVAGVAIGLGGDRLPDIPIIGAGDTEAIVHLRWCPTSFCGEPTVTPEEAVALLEQDPAADDVLLISAEEVRALVQEAMGEPLDGSDELTDDDLAPVVEVQLDTDEALLDVAWRFHEMIPGVTISPTGFGTAPTRALGADDHRGFDPRAATSTRTTVATIDGIHLDVWQVERGGVCYEVDGLVSCHSNALIVDGVGREQGAWGRLEDGGVCVWGTAGLENDEVVVAFQDGTTVTAGLGTARDVLLGRAYLACTEADTYPVEVEARAPGGSGGGFGSGEGQSAPNEVVRDDPEALRRLVRHLQAGLDEDDLQAAFGDGTSDDLRAAAEALADEIDRTSPPEGFDDHRVVGSGVETADDGATYVYAVVEARGATNPPRCVDVRLDVDGDDEGLWISERTWTRGACPTP